MEVFSICQAGNQIAYQYHAANRAIKIRTPNNTPNAILSPLKPDILLSIQVGVRILRARAPQARREAVEGEPSRAPSMSEKGAKAPRILPAVSRMYKQMHM